jgi:predicted MFS family arabinose efflux permease
VTDALEILVSALRFQNPSTAALDSFTDAEWKSVREQWSLQRLTIFLRQARPEHMPNWVRDEIDVNLADNAQRFERIKQTYARVARETASAGAEHVVLKGFSHWPGFVEHPRLRYQTDIDLFCPNESLLLTRAALTKLDYKPEESYYDLPMDHLPPMIPKKPVQWRGNPYDPEMEVSFELHFQFWNPRRSRLYPAGLEDFWARRVVRPLDDITFSGLCDVDNIGYASLNLLRDLLSGIPDTVKIYEIARFLHTTCDDEMFWHRWRECHDPSLRRLEAVCFQLASTWFANRVAPQVEEEIERLPAIVKSWFAQRADAPLLQRPPLYRDNVWLHMGLVEAAKNKAAIFVRGLIPIPPPADAPYVLAPALKIGGWPKTTWRKYTNYLSYATGRAIAWAQVLPPTLGRGLKLACSSSGLNGQFWTFFTAAACFEFGMMIFFFFYNLFLLDLGFHEQFLGWVTSALAIGGLAGALPAGAMARRIGLRNSLLMCFSLTAVFSATRALVSSPVALVGLAFVAGTATTIWAVVISPAIAQLTDEKNRSLGFSVIFSSAVALGIVSGFVCGHLPGWLAYLHPGIAVVEAKRASLLIGSAISALGVWPASRLRMQRPPASTGKVYPRNPFVYRYLMAMAVWTLVLASIPPFATAYFSRHIGMTVARIGSVFSAAQVAQMIATLAAPVLFRRLGTITGIAAAQVATAIALVGLARVQGPAPAMLLYVLFNGAVWMSEPGILALLMNRVKPEERTGVSALNFLVMGLVNAIAAASTGMALTRFGYPTVLGAAAGVAVVSAILFRFLLGNPLPEVVAGRAQGSSAPTDRHPKITEAFAEKA